MLVEAEFFEMTNLNAASTGLGYTIWIVEVGGQHSPRIKVSNTKCKFAKSNNFVLSIAKEPVNYTPKFTKIPTKDVEDVKTWIKQNYDELMKLWDMYEIGIGDDVKILAKLKKLDKNG